MKEVLLKRRSVVKRALFVIATSSALLAWAGCAGSEEFAALEETMQEPPSPAAPDPKATQEMAMRITAIKDAEKAATAQRQADSLKAIENSSRPSRPVETNVPPPPLNPPETYAAARKGFESRKYDEAIQAYQSLLDANVSEDLSNHCHYWIGESYFGKSNYAEAKKHFEMVFQFKKSLKKADAQLMIARCYELLRKNEEAKKAYDKFITNYPTSSKLMIARQRRDRL